MKAEARESHKSRIWLLWEWERFEKKIFDVSFLDWSSSFHILKSLIYLESLISHIMWLNYLSWAKNLFKFEVHYTCHYAPDTSPRGSTWVYQWPVTIMLLIYAAVWQNGLVGTISKCRQLKKKISLFLQTHLPNPLKWKFNLQSWKYLCIFKCIVQHFAEFCGLISNHRGCFIWWSKQLKVIARKKITDNLLGNF